MTRASLLAISACLLLLNVACNEDSDDIQIAAADVESESYPVIHSSSSIIIDEDDIILFPLSLNHSENDSYNSRSMGAAYWNFIFYRISTGESELLTKNKLIIKNFQVGNRETGPSSKKFSDSLIYYEVINSDFDGDKKLTTNDPQKLFISNLDGKGFTQISPPDANLVSWKIDAKRNLILMNMEKDINGDKKFDEKDEIDYFIYNLKAKAAAKPVFSVAFKTSVNALSKKLHSKQ